MLEFQEDYFYPEIREGFYIDTTMKTMWAALMEVLAHVSVICEKYNIQWYAAYGTLLGAIRHEGFVPWDDDLDIWVMREGYNRLMEVLPKELPTGYVVQSALTSIGYDQLHTCVNNGNGVSIRKEWLEEYHGCPFTVGLDIFPLDYLPRKEGEREVQKKLFEITARAGYLAMCIWDKEYEGKEQERDSAIDEIMSAKDYIGEFCGFKIEDRLIENEKWNRVSSEFMKCANYVAMMYGEEDGDYLVEYRDYMEWEKKKFPKEWSSEVYSATYENLMIPVPCGYDDILRTIYGDYHIKRRNGGLHEYPFYARQLRELRKIVRKREEAVDPSLAQKEYIPDNIFPSGWKDLIKDKKVVLFEDGIQIYLEYGDSALDKLEEVLDTFRQAEDKIALWWRPQPMIKEALELFSPEMLERYLGIVDNYKQAAWGVYDASKDDEYVEKFCDAYYGEMSARVKKFEGKKPIMIESIEA